MRVLDQVKQQLAGRSRFMWWEQNFLFPKLSREVKCKWDKRRQAWHQNIVFAIFIHVFIYLFSSSGYKEYDNEYLSWVRHLKHE